MLNLNPNSKTTPPSYEQMILSEIRGLKDNMRELKDDMRDLRTELRNTKQELNDRIDRVETRIDKFDNEIRSAMRHSQIMAASVVGIALAVVYFIFTH